MSEFFGIDGAKARLIDGAIGGIVGFFQGYKFGQAWTQSIINKKDAYSSNEEYLKQNIAQLQYRNKEVEWQIKQINKMMVSIEKDSKRKLSKKDATAVRNYAQCGVGLIDKDIATASKIKATSTNASEIAQLRSEIATLSKQRAALQAQSDRITSSSYCV